MKIQRAIGCRQAALPTHLLLRLAEENRVVEVERLLNPVTGRCEKIDSAEFRVDTKCMLMLPRTLYGHPGAIFYADEFTPILKVDFFTSS